jgi:predicted nucleic acid-binding protein
MVFVVDTSVTLNWYFADEIAPEADAAFASIGTRDAVVPVLWWFEVRNALVMNERRGRLDVSRTVEILAHLETLPIRADSAQDSETILALARVHRLTVYDAAYLELARRLDAPLATLDQALATAARAAAVPLLGENGTDA